MVTAQEQSEFRSELTALLNHHSAENGSGTPDYLLAEFLLGCLRQFNETLQARAVWYGGHAAEMSNPTRTDIPINKRPGDEQAADDRVEPPDLPRPLAPPC